MTTGAIRHWIAPVVMLERAAGRRDQGAGVAAERIA